MLPAGKWRALAGALALAALMLAWAGGGDEAAGRLRWRSIDGKRSLGLDWECTIHSGRQFCLQRVVDGGDNQLYVGGRTIPERANWG